MQVRCVLFPTKERHEVFPTHTRFRLAGSAKCEPHSWALQLLLSIMVARLQAEYMSGVLSSW